MFMIEYHHRCKDVERIGWQVLIVQARWNDWELPSESVWHCWFVGVIIESYDLWFARCFSQVSMPDISVELRTIGVFGLGRLWSLGDCST